MGLARHPSKQYLEELCAHSDMLNLSLHICREYMKDLFNRKMTVFNDLAPFWNHFKRIQFNYYSFFTNNDIPPKGYDAKAKGLLSTSQLSYFVGKELIFPISSYSQKFINEHLLPVIRHYKATLFFDGSHGQGRAPEKWDAPLIAGVDHGYAGSLGPENITEQLEKIFAALPPGATIWTDAETGLMHDDHKTNPDKNHWNLEKVWAMCDRITQFELAN